MAQSGYLGLAAEAANSFVEGENRTKGKKDNDLVTQLKGEAVKAVGAKLLSGEATSSGHPKRVGELVNGLSSWHQGNYGSRSYGSSGDYNGYGNRGMSDFDGYNKRSNNAKGGYGYSEARAGSYSGGGGWNSSPSTNRGYDYESRGYGGDTRWSSSGINGSGGWDRGRQGYYSSNNYEGYGNRGRMNDGYYSDKKYEGYGDPDRMIDGYYNNNKYEGYGDRGRMNDGYYNNNKYKGYGDHGRMNDGYDRWNDNP